MKAPKLLSWIASKAGLSEELTLKLWRRAASESETLCGCWDSAEYYEAAMSRFIELAEDESGKMLTDRRENALPNWLSRRHEHLAQTNLRAMQNINQHWQSGWAQLIAPHKQSAHA